MYMWRGTDFSLKGVYRNNKRRKLTGREQARSLCKFEKSPRRSKAVLGLGPQVCPKKQRPFRKTFRAFRSKTKCVEPNHHRPFSHTGVTSASEVAAKLSGQQGFSGFDPGYSDQWLKKRVYIFFLLRIKWVDRGVVGLFCRNKFSIPKKISMERLIIKQERLSGQHNLSRWENDPLGLGPWRQHREGGVWNFSQQSSLSLKEWRSHAIDMQIVFDFSSLSVGWSTIERTI